MSMHWGREVFWRVVRPMSYCLIAWGLLLWLPHAALPSRWVFVLQFSAKLIMAVAFVLASTNMVDVLGDWMAQRAAQTARKLDDHLVPLTIRIIKLVVIALGSVFVLQNLGIDVRSLMAGLGIGGLALAFAAKETLANVFGTMTIFADKPFQIGDWIVLNGAEGAVEQVGFRSTRLRTASHTLVTVPNAKIVDSIIDNLSARDPRRVQFVLGLNYQTSPEQIQSIVEGIRNILLEQRSVKKNSIEVYFSKIGAVSLDVSVTFSLDVHEQASEVREKHNILMAIMKLSGQLGVSLASPKNAAIHD